MAGLLASFFGAASSSQQGPSPPPQAPTWSFPRLQQLYDRLSQFKESDLEKGGGGDAVVETVRQITEALIWGEQNDTNFFDFFCEKSILADFIRVIGLKRAPKKVKVQLLQTLSMLVQNVRRTTSVFYLLSNNHVNKLIAMKLDFNDEEILAYYITLLKSLAMRLDSQTIKFFFIQHPEPVFPLYIEATKFLRHKDQMVRATVRTITLQVYRLEDPAMRTFVLRHASESYFGQLAGHLRDLWTRLDAAVGSAAEDDLSAAQHENELQQDLLIYLSDVFELGVPDLNDLLADRLLNGAVFPVLLSSIVALPDRDSDANVLSSAVALFLLRQVIDVFRCPVLVAPLAAALLEPTLPDSLLHLLPIVSEIQGTAHPRAGDAANPVRESFLRFLRGSDDTLFLLASAVVHALVQNRRAVPAATLLHARIFAPSPEDDAPQSQHQGQQPRFERTSSGGHEASAAGMPRVVQEEPRVAQAQQLHRNTSGQDHGAPAALDPEQQIEVTLLLLQALQRHGAWSLDTLQGLCRIVVDIILHPSLCHHPHSRSIVARALRSLERAAAQRLRAFIQDGIADSDDSLLDMFMEEWEHHRATPVNMTELCGNPRRLLLAVAPTRHGAGGRGRGSRRPSLRPSASKEPSETPQKAVRCYLFIRRLFTDFSKFGPHVPRVLPPDTLLHMSPWIAPSDEASPLLREDVKAQKFQEGASFEIGRTERIACGIDGPNGKHTRYLILHEHFFILVQPDVASPGWCVVRTSWPLQLVQSLIDRGDPRILQIGMQTYQAVMNTGEAASAFSPGLGEHADSKIGAVFTLSLNFEDVRHCCAASMHLQRRRAEVRSTLLRKAAAFVERSLS